MRERTDPRGVPKLCVEGKAMEAGIVFYRRDAGSLIGQWAHDNTGGILSREIVHGVAEGWEGHWPVEIFAGDDLFFQGTLRSVKFGDCLKLTWRGKFKDGSLHIYEGIGYVIDAATAAASFEEVPKADEASSDGKSKVDAVIPGREQR